MKLLRVGDKGQEIVAALDSNKDIRDLSEYITDLSPKTLNYKTLNKLNKLDLEKLRKIDSKIRIGSCVSSPVWQ